MGSDFAVIWDRIRQHRREVFTTTRGLKFTYIILGNWVVVSDTDFRITKNSFENAYHEMPVDDPAELGENVQGKYFIYAILTDPRITAVNT
jgi:hypothetical protein